MGQYALKILLSATTLVAIAELAKRSSFWGAALASLPLTSLLAFVWLYHDTGNSETIANLSYSIFWLVLPSLTLFLMLPFLLRHGLNFWFSLLLSCIGTAAAYWLLVRLLKLAGISL